MNLAYIPSPTFSKFEIGPFTIHMYAICILIGICVAVWILATRWKRYGGTFDQILDTTLVTVPCALVGARLYHCITTPADYFPPTGNLVNILKVWEGGMAIFGGISVGTLVAFLWCRHKHYPFAIFADAIAPALPVAQAVPHQVHGELLAGLEPVGKLVAEVDDERGANEVPDHLVQERRVEQRGPVVRALRAGIADFGFADGVRVVELQAPRQRGGPAVELLVEPVAESADGLGRTWIENVRINYSTVILGLRTNVWTAIIVFVLGCILFVVLYQYGPDPKAQARGLAAVTADELERQSIEEEQLRQKKQAKHTK